MDTSGAQGDVVAADAPDSPQQLLEHAGPLGDGPVVDDKASEAAENSAQQLDHLGGIRGHFTSRRDAVAEWVVRACTQTVKVLVLTKLIGDVS